MWSCAVFFSVFDSPGSTIQQRLISEYEMADDWTIPRRTYRRRLRCWASLTDQTKNEEYFVRLMAAKTGRRYYIRTRTLARSHSPSIPLPRESSMRVCGLRGKDPGRMAPFKDRDRDCINRLTAATPGDNSQKDCRLSNKAWAVSASLSRRAIPTVFMPRSTRRDSAVSIVQTMPARVGDLRIPKDVCGDEPATSRKLRSILRTET